MFRVQGVNCKTIKSLELEELNWCTLVHSHLQMTNVRRSKGEKHNMKVLHFEIHDLWDSKRINVKIK